MQVRALLVLVLVAACGAAACGARPRMVPAGETGVGELRLVGVDAVDEDELVDGLGLTHARETGQPFARFLVALDRRRIRSYYVRRGFFAVDVQSAVERVGQRADVTFTVQEGARAKLARIELLGLPDDPRVDPEVLREAVALADGEPFDHAAWDLAKPEITEAMQSLGYAWAQIDGVVLADKERAEAVIRVTIDAGPLTTFGKVTITGVPEGLEGMVEARVRVKTGDRFTPLALERTRAELYETGRFSLVRVEPDRKVRGVPVVNVAVHVAEAPRHELRLGGGVGLDPASAEIRGRAQYGVAGWPTPLTSTRVELRPALSFLRDGGDGWLGIAGDDVAPRLEANAALDRIDLVRPRYAGTLEGSFSYIAIEPYTSFGPRVGASLRSPVYAGLLQASLGWYIAVIGYSEVSDIIQADAALEQRLGLDRTDRIGAYEQTIVIDLRDDKLNPRSGGYFDLRLEEGTTAAGGELSYLRVVPEARGYLPIWKVVLAARARVGALWGDVTATRRFFAGGANSQRGFPERQMSPFATGVNEDGETQRVPYGGTGLIETSAEVRFPLFWRLTGTVFVDGGDVTETWDALDAGNLHWAAGGGLRLLFGRFAVRFDVGQRLNRTGDGNPRPGEERTYHIAIGEAF